MHRVTRPCPVVPGLEAFRSSRVLESKFRSVVLFDGTAGRAVPPAVDEFARRWHLDRDLHGEWRAFVTELKYTGIRLAENGSGSGMGVSGDEDRLSDVNANQHRLFVVPSNVSGLAGLNVW